jgi:tRNA(adenine34) deaminase
MKELSTCPFPKIFPSQLEKENIFFMQLAYNEAINAWNADEVPVGAVIARGDEVIASSFNQTRLQNDPSAHAEMIAITMAAKSVGDWRLNDCRLYVTKEPCPMCSGATIMARLGEVHFAVDDPKMGGLGGATSLHSLPFSNHKPKVYRQTMELECKEMLQAFFQLQRQ